jgi:hypothetical protein
MAVDQKKRATSKNDKVNNKTGHEKQPERQVFEPVEKGQQPLGQG